MPRCTSSLSDRWHEETGDLSGDATSAAVSMVRRFLHAAQEALGCLVLHLERGLSLYGQQLYELSAGGDRRDLCSVVPLTLGTVL